MKMLNNKIIKKVLECIREHRLPYFLVVKISKLNFNLYKYNLKMKTFLYNFKNKSKANSGKYLYASAVGKDGKELLAKTIKQFGNEEFDYLIFSYDGTAFNEDIYSRCRIIQEKGFKYDFAAKYLTEEYCRKYDFIFLWDDDIDVEELSYRNFINIMKRNNLEMAQAALTPKSYHSHNLTVQDKNYEIGRYVDFVEVMAPVFRSDAWVKFRNIAIGGDSPWGWGYDFLAKSYCGYANMGIVDCETITHTRPIQSGSTNAPLDMRNLFKKYKNLTRAKRVSYGRLK